MNDTLDPEDVEPVFQFYVYDHDQSDPRYSLCMTVPEVGTQISLFDRVPDGAGMWHHLDASESEHDPVQPSDQLEDVLGRLVAVEEGVPREDVDALAPHERHFVQIVAGIAKEKMESIPEPIRDWVHDLGSAVDGGQKEAETTFDDDNEAEGSTHGPTILDLDAECEYLRGSGPNSLGVSPFEAVDRIRGEDAGHWGLQLRYFEKGEGEWHWYIMVKGDAFACFNPDNGATDTYTDPDEVMIAVDNAKDAHLVPRNRLPRWGDWSAYHSCAACHRPLRDEDKTMTVHGWAHGRCAE